MSPLPATVILMADGPQRRWTAEGDKHLAPVLEEPLIHRTLRLLAENRVTDPVVFTRNSEVAGKATKFAPPLRLPSLAAACAVTCDLWRGDVLFLAGDVVFSERALPALLARAPGTAPPWAFFGKRGANRHTGKPWAEIYAFRASGDGIPAALSAMGALAAGSYRRKGFRELYRVLKDVRPDRTFLPGGAGFHAVPDWTDDIDTTEDHARLARYLENRE